ncbi:MAG: L-aspartate oxidase [Candidatus Manganitrophus sp.]|nr:L-aspartate oxidase [Candidatus Manganitrophus sp.]
MTGRSKPIIPISTDFLIIGSGVAGLRAAIEASRHGEVIVLNKGRGNESNSTFAQGGIAAALSEEEEEIQSHIEDTIDAGKGLCRPEAVRILVEEGPQRIHELIAWGAEFDKIGDRYAFAREGAHRHSRILRAKGDATGNEIIRTLVHEAQKRPNIKVRNGHFTIDLFITTHGRKRVCGGVWVLDEREERLVLFRARAVILATGGAGQVYRRTTNPPVATGDGIAMALRAGVPLEDMEFFQFHPTALSLPSAPCFLLSEAMRGEGAILRDADGKPFMDRYHPDKELAPRDVVTRAIWDEMQHGAIQNVLLDLTHLKPTFVKERFPMIYATCLQYGIDITHDQIPVAPSAHYLMGGVKTGLWGETSLPGLWAVGEVACAGVHGANRLASNSLLEGLVFGMRVGHAVAQTSPLLSAPEAEASLKLFKPASKERYLLVQKELRETMWNNVGIIRSEASLLNAIEKWKGWGWVLRKPALSRLALESRNMLIASAAMMEAALKRKESIGAHYREDFPAPNEGTSRGHVDLTGASLRRRFPEI